jgi:HAD superfamily hydrolase (TIGR01509 family)
MKYKCIILDWDGVLVDTEAISIKVLMELSKPLGLIFDREEAITVFTGLSLMGCFQYILDRVSVSLPEDMEAQFRKRTFELFKQELQPIEGIHELISKITVPFCVASSGPQNKIELNLKLTNLYNAFEGNIFSCFDIGKFKPDPAIFLHAAKTMGFEPKDCVVIEDSIHGVNAAVAGGFKVFGFASEKSADSLRKGGATLFYKMEDLYELL